MATSAARKQTSRGLLLGLPAALAVLLATPGPTALHDLEGHARAVWTTVRTWALGPASRDDASDPPSRIAVGPDEGEPLSGAYRPMDERTATLAGTVVFVAAEVRLETGGLLETRPHRLVMSHEAAGRDATWAALMDLPAGVQVEVREVVDGQAPALCEGAALRWLALVQGGTEVVLLPLADGPPPDPERSTPPCPPLRLEKR